MAWLNIQIATFGTQHNIWRSFRSTADRPPPQSSNCCGRVGIHRVQTRFRPYTYIMMPSINSANIITIFDVYYPVSYFLTIIQEEVCELWEEREVNATIIVILIYNIWTTYGTTVTMAMAWNDNWNQPNWHLHLKKQSIIKSELYLSMGSLLQIIGEWNTRRVWGEERRMQQ